MPTRDQYLLAVGSFALVGGAIAATALDPLAVAPFALLLAAAIGLAVRDNWTAPRVLLVGPTGTPGLASLENVVAGTGRAITRCEGTFRNDCPALSGGDCPYGKHVAATVIVDSDRWRAAPCGAALHVEELRVDGAVLGDPLRKIGLLKQTRAFLRQ